MRTPEPDDKFIPFSIVTTEGSGVIQEDRDLNHQIRQLEFIYAAGGCWRPAHDVTVWYNGKEKSSWMYYEKGKWYLALEYSAPWCGQVSYEMERVQSVKAPTPETMPMPGTDGDDVLPSALLIRLLNDGKTTLDINDHSGLVKLNAEITLDLPELLYTKEMAP